MKMRLFMEIHSFLSLQLLVVLLRQDILTNRTGALLINLLSVLLLVLNGTMSGLASYWVNVLVFMEQLFFFFFLLWDG